MKASKCDGTLENALPSVPPSTASPSNNKRNVTFNIYEEVHGDVPKELVNGEGQNLTYRLLQISFLCHIICYSAIFTYDLYILVKHCVEEFESNDENISNEPEVNFLEEKFAEDLLEIVYNNLEGIMSGRVTGFSFN